jgi:hypothetical protein
VSTIGASFGARAPLGYGSRDILGGLFLLSPTAWAIRLADVAWSLAAAWALVRLLRPEAGRLAAAVAATAWIGWHHHALFDHGGVYTEHYGALAGLIALACRGAVASGLWVTAAGLFKHPGAAVLVASSASCGCRAAPARLDDLRRRRRRAARPAERLAVAVGAWDNFLYANLWIVLQHGRFDQAWDYRLLLLLWRSVVELAAVLPGMAAAVVLGLVATVFTRTPLALATSTWWLVAMAGVLLQGRYFEHHYLLVLPPIALLGGIGVGWLAHLRPGEHVVVRGLRLAAGAAVLWWGWGIVQAEYMTRREVFGQRWAQVVQGPSAWPVGPMRPFEAAVGRFIRDRTTPDDRVHVQGFNPTLLHIYWYAERPPGAPVFYEVPFVLDRPLQLKQVIAGDPAFVVIDRTAPMDPFMLAWLERDYQVEQTFGETYVADVSPPPRPRRRRRAAPPLRRWSTPSSSTRPPNAAPATHRDGRRSPVAAGFGPPPPARSTSPVSTRGEAPDNARRGGWTSPPRFGTYPPTGR